MRDNRRDVRPGTDGLAAKYYEDEIGTVLTRTVEKRLRASNNTSVSHRPAIPVSAEAWHPIGSILDKAADAAIAAANADAAAAERSRPLVCDRERARVYVYVHVHCVLCMCGSDCTCVCV